MGNTKEIPKYKLKNTPRGVMKGNRPKLIISDDLYEPTTQKQLEDYNSWLGKTMDNPETHNTTQPYKI